MPGFIGKKLCPELIIVKSNFTKYQEVSQQVREILVEYDPVFSPMGLDEAYLDLTSYVTQLMNDETGHVTSEDYHNIDETDTGIEDCIETCLDDTEKYETEHEGVISLPEHEGVISLPDSYWECALRVVTEMRERIEERTCLTASAGIAVNKMLAKIASDVNKPNGQYFIPPEREKILHFIRSLPIRKVTYNDVHMLINSCYILKVAGIGKVTEKMLKSLSIESCQDLYDNRAILKLLFSKLSFEHFLNISLGIGSYTIHKYIYQYIDIIMCIYIVVNGRERVLVLKGH